MAERALAAEVPADANAHCPGTSSETAGKSAACAGCPNQEICATAPKGPDPDLLAIEQRMRIIKHKILVLSGKGGVGKSTFSAQLAFALAAKNREVGLLDIDICGPSIPKMLGLEGEEIHQSNAGWSPVYVEDNLGVMSIGFMLQNPDDAVIWRGPRKNALIKQFLKDVDWGAIDYLVVDAPPGTSDEHISIAQFLKASRVDGAIIVTTPQEVSIIDVRKEVNFCKKVGIPILGVVENMSGLRQQLHKFKFFRPAANGSQQDVTQEVLQHLPADLQECIAQTEVFHASKGGAEQMAREMQVPFLGKVPLDPLLSKAAEEGRSAFSNSPLKGSVPLEENAKGKPALSESIAQGNGFSDSSAQEMNASAASGHGLTGNISKGAGKQFMPSVPALQAIIDQLMRLTEGESPTGQAVNGVHVAQNGRS